MSENMRDTGEPPCTPAEPDADDLARLAGCLSDAAWPQECPHDDNDPHAPCWDCVAVAAARLLAPRTPDAHLAAAKAEALEEAADAWTEWEVYEDADGARSIRRRDVPLPSWLRARAARLREQGGDQ